MNINGKLGLQFAPENNILKTGGASVTSLVDANEGGHYKTTFAKMGGDAVTEPSGLVYLAVFKTAADFSASSGIDVTVTVTTYDDEGTETSFDPMVFTVTPGTSFAPPTNVLVSDVPDDQGHQLRLTWTLSRDDATISHYNIYRSRKAEITTPVSIENFTTIDALKEAELATTILIASVPKGTRTYLDAAVPLNNVPYYYWVEAASPSGSSAKIAAGYATAVKSRPSRFHVSAAYPNPFNPATTIMFEVPDETSVRLVMYDILGREIAVLEDGVVSAGVHQAVWDGRDKNGQMVGAGIYIYRFTAGSFSSKGKVTFLR